MTKKIVTHLTLLLAALMLCMAQAAAMPATDPFAELAFAQRDGFTTVITDTRGNSSTYEGVLRVSALEQSASAAQIASYAIYSGDDAVLTVQLHDIAPQAEVSLMSGSEATNGYYSAELPVAGGYTAFLTGLSPEYAATLTDGALDAISEGREYRLEDAGFIDTEKQYLLYDENAQVIDTDEEMCWAAATSNILHYTGWAQRAGFPSTDYMFEKLIAEFTDFAGNSSYALQWFFNGYYYPYQIQNTASQPDGDYAKFGGFQPDYYYGSLVEEHDMAHGAASLSAALEKLKAGWGAEISIGWHEAGARQGGHAITLWGAVYKTDADLSAKDNWYALVIADSDSDITHGGNRRSAPNSLTLTRITPTTMLGKDSWTLDAYETVTGGVAKEAVLEEATLLKPYSEALETDGGTGNILADPDLTVESIRTAVQGSVPEIEKTFFAADEPVRVNLDIRNISKKNFEDTVSFELVVTKAGTNEEVYHHGPVNVTLGDSHRAAGAGFTVPLDPQELQNLTAGAYEVTARIDSKKGETTDAAPEAYLSNNTLTKTFYVGSAAAASSTLSCAPSAVFDGKATGGQDAHGGLGCLKLAYDGELGFEAAQYRVELSYDGAAPEAFYLGHERPETVYGLRPSGEQVKVDVYVTPADGVGFERQICSETVALSYFVVSMSTMRQAFWPIRETDTNLLNGDKITLTFDKTASENRNDAGFYVRLIASAGSESHLLYENVVATEDIEQPLTIQSFIVLDRDTPDWVLSTLPAGTYLLTAYVSYGVIEPENYVPLTLGSFDPQTYRYCDPVEIGSLTVEPALPGKPEVQEPPSIVYGKDEDKDQSIIVAKVTTGAFQASLKVTAYLYNDTDDLDSLDPNAFTAGLISQYTGSFGGGTIEYSFPFTTTPGTTYLYRLEFIMDEGLETEYKTEYSKDDLTRFVAPSAPTPPPPPPVPEPPVCAALKPGENQFTMKHGEELALMTPVLNEDSLWRVTFRGPDGSVRVWSEEDADWFQPDYFTTNGMLYPDFSVQQGGTVRFLVTAHMAGDYQISCEMIGSGADRIFSVGADEIGLLAEYSADGQLLSVEEVDEGAHILPEAEDGKLLRAFVLDKTTYAPRAARVGN